MRSAHLCISAYTKPVTSNTAFTHQQFHFLGALSAVLRDAAPQDFYILIREFLHYSKELALVSLPEAFLPCQPSRTREVAAAPRRWHRESYALEGNTRWWQGHTRDLPSISCTFLHGMLGFPFFLSFSPLSSILHNNYFRFYSLFSLTRLSEGAEQHHCPRCLRFPPTQADVSPSLQDLMHCSLPSTQLISTTFCFSFFPSAGEISEPEPGSHL